MTTIEAINVLCEKASKNAVNKGFHDVQPENFGEKISLMHEELSEAIGEYRKGYKLNQTYYEKDGKPCGILSELADTCIRIFDFCGYHNLNLGHMISIKMAYNETREKMHGKVI